MQLNTHEAVPTGSEARGTVVFLHGFPLDGSMWHPQLSALADQGWRTLAPDLRGFGDTEINDMPGEVCTGRRVGGRIAHQNEPVLTMGCLADDVAEFIAGETDGRAVVCGLSMGGYVAFELWRRHPDRVRALVLADTRAQADDDEGRENRMRTAQAVRRAGAEPVAKTMVSMLMADATKSRAPELVREVRQMMLDTPPRTLIAALAGMAARHDVTAELPEINVPTLVLVGEEDDITPPEIVRAMADAIPGASFRQIPDAGHLPNLEQPESFNRELVDFLDRLA
jgi:pimeloyl-ACP methyl ester carboxylesterase